ncbi:MAG: DNA-directed RNA polymerase subunit A' [Hadesarchaea archaeon YNP_N21]|jgi:DNA-directed RNA polymerase subunit A'|nr:MAG: DNA-directed RNA polymerase subunit A' [Hadesarchaea archaeon YNP_N21]
MMRMKKLIDRIDFGLLSPDTIRKMAVTRIVTADTYDEDGYPIERGLMDPRLGVVDPGLRCRTCGGRAGECPGHFGYIELSRPVIHIGYVDTVHDCLRATCKKCGRILLPEEKVEAYRKQIEEARARGQKWWMISEEVKKSAFAAEKCYYCGEEQPQLKFEKPTTFIEGKNRLTPSEVRERLERIIDEDALLLGINPQVARPEWMVLTVLPVPPVTVRPSITLESGIRSEDDLTHKLVDIIRINQRLGENIEAGAPHLIVEDLWELLQYHVTTYFTNEVSGVPPARHRSGRILRMLAQRLKGKEGRFRGNLSGKRVDFSARTVVSPDPYISINEVGVPEYVAKTLTVPVRVTAYNIEYLRDFVRRGPDVHPGANCIITPDGKRYDLRYADREDLANKLDVGFMVERHLVDGDMVLFNRQPSLHRMSIMAHEVRVMPGRTFRLNLCVCPPYNADFDGDEMNLHVPQSEEAQAEARILMKVQEQILSPRFGRPIIGGIQDHITGAYLLTRRDTLLTREQAHQLLAAAGITSDLPEPVAKKGNVEYWSGKQIFSMLLPKDLNLTFTSRICENCSKCDEEECNIDAFVVIQDGELKSGVMDAYSYKALDRCELLDRIVKDYGTEAAREFLDRVTRMAIYAAMMFGFTTGIDDEDIPPEAQERIGEVLSEAKEKVNKLIEVYNSGELEPLPGRSLRETLEMRIMEILAESRDRAGEIAEKYLGLDNHAVIMARTGARGSMLNLTQMAACVGQQSVRGERISRGYKGRTLPHFKAEDLGADARGFVSSSYKLGLQPLEFFFHAMGGREGLVDTAVRTAQSGYMQRRLINALQDLRVEYDSTVRDNRGSIIQFLYGEDGVDPARSDAGKAVNVERIIEREMGYRGE